MNNSDLMEMLNDIKTDLKEDIYNSKKTYETTCKNSNLMTIQNMINLKENEAKLEIVQYIVNKIEMRMEDQEISKPSECDYNEFREY